MKTPHRKELQYIHLKFRLFIVVSTFQYFFIKFSLVTYMSLKKRSHGWRKIPRQRLLTSHSEKYLKSISKSHHPALAIIQCMPISLSVSKVRRYILIYSFIVAVFVFCVLMFEKKNTFQIFFKKNTIQSVAWSLLS